MFLFDVFIFKYILIILPSAKFAYIVKAFQIKSYFARLAKARFRSFCRAQLNSSARLSLPAITLKPRLPIHWINPRQKFLELRARTHARVQLSKIFAECNFSERSEQDDLFKYFIKTPDSILISIILIVIFCLYSSPFLS